MPNSIIILDKDLIDKYQEELEIKRKINSLRENLNFSLFDLEEVIDSSKKCQWSVLKAEMENKFKNVRVCYNCYSFYSSLYNEVIRRNGSLNNSVITRITNPTFKETEKRNKEQKEIEDRVKLIL